MTKLRNLLGWLYAKFNVFPQQLGEGLTVFRKVHLPLQIIRGERIRQLVIYLLKISSKFVGMFTSPTKTLPRLNILGSNIKVKNALARKQLTGRPTLSKWSRKYLDESP